MENKQYEHDSLNNKEMFQEYINSLPEEEGEKKEETGQERSGISKQVEEDLLEYSRKGYDRQRQASTTRSSYRRTRSRRGGAIAAILLTGGLAVTIAGFTGLMVARNTYSEAVDEPFEYVEPMEDPWEDAYSQMSGSLTSPEAVVDGHYISLPMKYSDFMQEDWKVRSSAFSDDITTVGEQPVALHIETDYGYDIADISVVSPTGEEVALEDALITGVSFDSEGTWVELNGGLSIGSGTWTIENALSEEGVEWVKRGSAEGSRYIVESSTKNEYGYDEYVLRLELEDDYTERIVMQLSPGELPPGE
jgi:hypothetical protein